MPPAVPRSRRRLRSATEERPPPCQPGPRSERVRGATQFATRDRSSRRPPVRRRCAGRWSLRRCRSRRPPVRGTARRTRWPRRRCRGASRRPRTPSRRERRRPSRRRPGPAAVALSGRPGSSAPPCGHPTTVSVRDATAGAAGVDAGAGIGGDASGLPTSSHRHDQLDDQQQAQKPTFSTGGRCRSGHCSPVPLAPACRRWTRAPSCRRRCRSPNATRRSSS